MRGAGPVAHAGAESRSRSSAAAVPGVRLARLRALAMQSTSASSSSAPASGEGGDATGVPSRPGTRLDPQTVPCTPVKKFLALIGSMMGLAAVDPGWNTPVTIAVAPGQVGAQGRVNLKKTFGLAVAPGESIRILKLLKRLDRLGGRLARLQNARPKYVGPEWYQWNRQVHRVTDRIHPLRRHIRNRVREVHSATRKILETCSTVAIYPRLEMNRMVRRRGRKLGRQCVRSGLALAPCRNRDKVEMGGKVRLLDTCEAYTSSGKPVSGEKYNPGGKRVIRVTDKTIFGVEVHVDVNRDLLASVAMLFTSVFAIEIVPWGQDGWAIIDDEDMKKIMEDEVENGRAVQNYRKELEQYVVACGV
jgi:hypothetical protein